MDIDQIIKAAVEPIVPVCTIDVYGGNATEFCVYTYTETPMAFGDDEPHAIRYTVRLHWCFPWKPGVTASAEVKAKKKQLKHALHAAGMTYPTVSSAGDDQWAELVFEAEYIDGEV
ncbi:hypothetical protein [Dysosmobacter sp.]|uniref:hypothetical protein n=1 Tax=Dysosmobacter sp. TaxID=2591382 RepID=UPI003AB1F378